MLKSEAIKKKKYLLVLASTALLCLTGCEKELANNGDDVPMLDTTEEVDGNISISRFEKVDGEDFQLEVLYSCDESSWRVTDTKHLYMSINTVNLPENKEVYIDNIFMLILILFLHKQCLMVFYKILWMIMFIIL